MADKLNSFFKLAKTALPINSTLELKETFDSVDKALSDACELAPKQSIPGNKLVLMTDASFRSVGYAHLIEDNLDQKILSKRKTYARVAFGSKNFCPAQLKMSIYSKKFLAIYMPFCKKQRSHQFFALVTNLSHVFAKRKQLHQHCGTHVIMCCNSTSK